MLQKIHLVKLNNFMDDTQSNQTPSEANPLKKKVKGTRKNLKKTVTPTPVIPVTASNIPDILAILKDAVKIQSITKKSRKNVDELEAMVATCEEFMGSFVILGYSLEGEQIPPIVHCHNQQVADAIGNYLQKFIHYNIRSNDNMD